MLDAKLNSAIRRYNKRRREYDWAYRPSVRLDEPIDPREPFLSEPAPEEMASCENQPAAN